MSAPYRRHGPARLVVLSGIVLVAASGLTAKLRADVPDEEQKTRTREAILGIAIDGDPDSNKDGLTDAADLVLFVPAGPAIHFSEPVSFWFKTDAGSIQVNEDDLGEARPVSFWFQTDSNSIVIDEQDLGPFSPVSFWFQSDASQIVIDENDAVQLGTPSFERQ